MPTSPVSALTATAHRETRADILAQLDIPDDGLILAGFDRPNIRYAISARDGLTAQLTQLVRDTPGPGIVYVASRDATERLATQIGQATGRPTRAYHAGLEPMVRAANQRAFVASEDMVMVATIAFGMGIDKPDVRFVAHAGLPKSIEGYYQETGRAGRDGDPAVAHLYWGAEDFARARRRIETESEEARRPSEARAAERAGQSGRGAGVPPRDPAAPLWRVAPARLRQLRQLPLPADGRRCDRAGAQAALRRLPDGAALRARATSSTCWRARRASAPSRSAMIASPSSGSSSPPRRRCSRLWRVR